MEDEGTAGKFIKIETLKAWNPCSAAEEIVSLQQGLSMHRKARTGCTVQVPEDTEKIQLSFHRK